MKMRLEATLIAKHGDGGKFGVKLASESVKEDLIAPFYLAMLKAMRDGHTREFYEAMAMFSEDDMDEMIDFFEGGADNE